MFLCGFLLSIFGIHVISAKLCFCPIHDDVAIYKHKQAVPGNIVANIDTINCFEGTLNDEWLKLTQYKDMYLQRHDIEGRECEKMTGHFQHDKRFILDGQSVWSEWGNFSVCQSCGTNGIQLRHRTCVKPIGLASDLCRTGSSTESRKCKGVPCPETYNWSLWTPWTKCSRTCDGQGTKVRYRSCVYGDLTVNNTACGDDKYYDIEGCQAPNCLLTREWASWDEWGSCTTVCPDKYQRCCGAGIRFRYSCAGQSCNNLCPGEYIWSGWSKWVCSVTCGSGTRSRTRHCLGADGQSADVNCNGTNIDQESCYAGLCHTVDGEWSTWSGWGSCDKTCGNASHHRQRQCDNPPPSARGKKCTGDSVQMLSCNETNPCPVNGRYSEWTAWSSCTRTCGGGTSFRSRVCDNPMPAYGGDLCDVGPPIEIDLCNTEHCPIDGGWSEWYDWSTCSVSCADGIRYRARNCTSPSPQYIGHNCTGNDKMSEPCNEGVCPIPGGWGEWGSWSGCACVDSLQTRQRSCDSPSPVGGGSPCVGQKTKVKTCTPGPTCPVQGMWASWEAWDGCNVTCGQGGDRRIRTCTHPRPANGGHYCDGDYDELVTCIEPSCPVNGRWSAWSAWTDCDVTCASGRRSHNRNCDSPAPAYGGTFCSGISISVENCTLSPCPVDGEWSTWSTWGDCDVTCGNGTVSRNRTCDNPEPQYGGNMCPGQVREHKTCVQTPCPVNGGFSLWSQWSDCSVTCGDGTRVRGRNCTNPLPAYGGKACVGPALETEVCNIEGCMVNGSWSMWSEWGQCTTTCGSGERVHYRACDHPKPQFGGEFCTGNYLLVDSCPNPECPVDGAWSDWGAWPTCSVSCGNGTRTRTRSCSNPLPTNGGHQCPGTNTDKDDCNTVQCPIDGNWSNWGDWTSCSTTCGHGNQSHARTCTNPAPAHGGTTCSGNSTMSSVCTMKECAVWSQWFYTQCSVTCGNGTTSRLRRCSSGHDGDCSGVTFENVVCNESPCPVDGQWSEWQAWSKCSVTCAAGKKSRDRTCTNPPAAHNGHACVGMTSDTKACNNGPCPVWSQWFYTKCSVTCGNGTTSRLRRCSSSHDEDCTGASFENVVCNDGPCPVDGGWGDWASWSTCSQTCGNGSHERTRQCDQPLPLYGGATCNGIKHETDECNNTTCPYWYDYHDKGQCSVTCGNGVIQLVRECSTGNRNDCTGSAYDENPCSMGACP